MISSLNFRVEYSTHFQRQNENDRRDETMMGEEDEEEKERERE